MRDDFAVFILSHGRADNVKTLKMLKDIGYTGKWYIIIDNEDKTADEYYRRFGDRVIMFDKKKAAESVDLGDNIDDRRVVVIARNAAYDIAEELGLTYFTQFDDDYTHFEYKYIEDGKLKPRKIVAAKGDSLGNRLFEAMIDFLEVSGVKTVAFAQGGDYIGGKDNYNFRRGFMRKAMNTFFCKTDRRINFVGRINEDTTTYCLEGSRGGLFLTIMKVSVDQTQTQKQKGGLTDTYLDLGTYVKSFYSVMYMPSCVKVSAMGNVDYRLHHSVSWNNCVPKILREDYKKVE